MNKRAESIRTVFAILATFMLAFSLSGQAASTPGGPQQPLPGPAGGAPGGRGGAPAAAARPPEIAADGSVTFRLTGC